MHAAHGVGQASYAGSAPQPLPQRAACKAVGSVHVRGRLCRAGHAVVANRPYRPQPRSAPRPSLIVVRADVGLDAGGSDNRVEETPSETRDDGSGPKQRPWTHVVRLVVAVVERLRTFFLALGAVLMSSRLAQFGLALTIISAGYTAASAYTHMRAANAPAPVLYSSFLSAARAGNVRAVRFNEKSPVMVFDLKVDKPGASKGSAKGSAKGAAAATATPPDSKYHVTPTSYTTRRLLPDDKLVEMLMAQGVEFGVTSAASSAAGQLLFTVAMLWIPLLPLLFVMKRFMGGGAGGPAAKGDKQAKGKPLASPVTFADVAGVDSAKAELQELVACLRHPARYAKLKARLPTGVLLVGPPGTGKTLLAKALAGEAGVPFFSAAASEFVEMYVGRGAARVRELFAAARRRAPAVVFIDELDAIGGKRGAGLNEERDQTLNQLLTEMDGFDSGSGVLVLAATNRPQVLDEALLRPGRLSRRVLVGRPTDAGRRQILLVHLRGVPLDEADPAGLAARIAAATPGCTGADLANVVNEASFLAARESRDVVTSAHLLQAVSRTRFGVGSGGGDGLEVLNLGLSLQQWWDTIGAPRGSKTVTNI